MYEDEEQTEVIGAFCTLIIPWRGHTEAIVVGDLGDGYIVKVGNGKEICVSHDDVLLYD